MAAEWYYTKDGKSRVGPLSDAELAEHARAGKLQPADMVKSATNPQWQPACDVDGLFPPVAEFAPPPAPPRPTSQPASRQDLLNDLKDAVRPLVQQALARWQSLTKPVQLGLVVALVALLLIACLGCFGLAGGFGGQRGEYYPQ